MTRFLIAGAMALACMLLLPVTAQAKPCGRFLASANLQIGTPKECSRKAEALQRRTFQDRRRHGRNSDHRSDRQRAGFAGAAYAPEYETRAVPAVSMEIAAAQPSRKTRRLHAAKAKGSALRLARAARAAPVHPAAAAAGVIAKGANLIKSYAARLAAAGSLDGVVSPLASKAREIAGACGSRVISSVRRTYVAGTHRISLHASGRAVDIAGNPGCIYAHLKRWPGGVSIDYARVRHVHFSYDPGGREWGVRFVHGGRKVRYADRRGRVYASVGPL